MEVLDTFSDRSEQIMDDSSMECKICWYIYDPKVGDDFWQVPPGTAFSNLPPEWSCPECDADKSAFLILDR